MAEKVWRSPIFGWLLLLGFAFAYTYMRWHIPSPGKAVAVLAAAAAIMSFRAEGKGWERFLWSILLIGFLMMEFKSIDKDRDDYENKRQAARQEEGKSFNKIADKITQAIQQSQEQFNATMLGLHDISATLGKNYGALKQLDMENRKQTAEVLLKRRAISLSTSLLNFMVTWESKASAAGTPPGGEYLPGEYSPDFFLREWTRVNNEMRIKAEADYKGQTLDVLQQIQALGENSTYISNSMVKKAIDTCNKFSDTPTITQCASEIGAVGREMR